MQITVFSCREFDEKSLFEQYEKEMGIRLVLCKDAPTLQNIELVDGSQCVDILTTKIDRELVEAFAKRGVRYLVTRTIGYDHIDRQACDEYGISVGNAPYGPHGVAEYTVMLILMSMRKAKRIIERTNIQDYTLCGNMGRELKDLTVGIIGTGRIGRCVLKNLSGFGCRLLAYDIYESEEVKEISTYVSLEQMWQEADIISLHAPLTEENFHMIGKNALSKMREDVIIINTARGGLIDSKALIEAIEQGRVGAAGLDVVEDEFNLYYYDHKSDVLSNRDLAVLRGFPNVTVTHHMAFYTDNCVETVVRDSLYSCKLFMEGKKNKWEIKA